MIKVLSDMRVVCFLGLSPDPEWKAHDLMEQWVKVRGIDKYSLRIFGHNTDQEGNISMGPEYKGYKLMVSTDDEEASEIIRAGKFVVLEIEGNFDKDPEGKFIMDGWGRLNDLVCREGYTVKQPPRWYEEELKASEPGNVRFDLYLEIE